MKQKKTKDISFKYEKQYKQFFNLDQLMGNPIDDVTSDRQAWTGDLDWPKHPASGLFKDVEKEDRY